MAIERLRRSPDASAYDTPNGEDGVFVSEHQGTPPPREETTRLVQYSPTRMDRSITARKLTESIADRLWDVTVDLNHLIDKSRMLAAGLPTMTAADAWRKKEEIKIISGMLQYYGYQLRQIEGLSSVDKNKREYIYRLGTSKSKRDGIERLLKDIEGEVDSRTAQLTELMEIEDSLYIVEAAIEACKQNNCYMDAFFEVDRNLQFAMARLRDSNNPLNMYPERREAMIRMALGLQAEIDGLL